MLSSRRIIVALAYVVAAGCSSGSGNGPQGTGGSTGAGGGGGSTGGTSTAGTTGSAGATGAGGSSGVSGTAGTGAGGTGTGGDAPIILSLATNVTTLMPDGTLVVTAVVTHPQGIAQIIGGTLNDPSGASYGAFMVSTTSGSYSFTLSWTALNMLQPVNTPLGGASRIFQVTFYDQAGHSTSRTITIQLECGTTAAICAGQCTTLDYYQENCGMCGRNCETLFSLSVGYCSTQGKCSGSAGATVLQSCNTLCQSKGLTCTGTGTVYYRTPGASSYTMATVDCTTIPASSSSNTPFSSISCTCAE